MILCYVFLYSYCINVLFMLLDECISGHFVKQEQWESAGEPSENCCLGLSTEGASANVWGVTTEKVEIVYNAKSSNSWCLCILTGK